MKIHLQNKEQIIEMEGTIKVVCDGYVPAKVKRKLYSCGMIGHPHVVQLENSMYKKLIY